VTLLIKVSGGIGVSYQGVIELSTLPQNLLIQVQSELSESNLLRLSSSESQSDFVTDLTSYEMQYSDSDRSFIIKENQLPTKVIDLLDSILPYLTLLPK